MVLDSKAARYGEVIVYLFEQCHLNCVFCHQDHNSTVGADRESILAKADKVIEWVNNKEEVDVFNIHLMGGELLQDTLINEGFLVYYREFISKLEQGIKRPEVNILISSALVFTEVDKVLEFLQDTKLNVSYDTKGRFTKHDLQVFKQNIEIFKPYIKLVSSVMIKATMKAIIKGDSYYEYLYNNFECVWDNLLPVNEYSKALMPSDSLSLEFYKKLIDQYPRIPNITHFVEGTPYNAMSCTRDRQLTIDDKGVALDVCPATAYPEIQITAAPETSDLVHKFFDAYNCATCEYYQRCTFTCFVKQDYMQTKRDLRDVCIYKELFNYVSKPRIPISTL